jgi:UDP-N-acetylglucosamine acyltransferase
MEKNQVHPTAILIGEIKMGFGNYIGPGSIIHGPITIGNDNYFGPYSSIGAPPEDDAISIKDHISMSEGIKVGEGSIQIGDRNIFREFVTINRGETSETQIQDEIYFMTKSHIGHDCKIQSKVKITSLVQVGGYSTIGFGANIGLSASLHQWTVIGAFSMIGMNSTVTRNIPPGSLALGSPTRIKGPNVFSLEKIGITDTNFWSQYLVDLDCPEVPHELIPSIENYKKELNERRLQQDLVKKWRIQALNNVRNGYMTNSQNGENSH